jgi:GT2 family glycosyltransferase
MLQADAIIPVFGESSENLMRTVEGLLSQEQTLHRILVVDDGSPVPVALPKQIAFNIELLRLEPSGGVAAARNHGAAASSADYLLFVNCDVVLRSNWLQAGLAFMESHPAAAVLGGPIAPRVGSPRLRRWRMRFLENPEQRTPEERQVTWVTGHATLVRRAMFEEVGGFDPRYRQSGEDHELCERLRALGYQIYHVPQLVADSYEVPSIDLFARKILRHSGWNVRPTDNETDFDAVDVRPVVLLPTSASVIRTFANLLGRDLYKRRMSFVPIDVAVAARSFFLVWTTCLRRLRERH